MFGVRGVNLTKTCRNLERLRSLSPAILSIDNSKHLRSQQIGPIHREWRNYLEYLTQPYAMHAF